MPPPGIGLSDLTVIQLGQGIPSAYCAKLLADLGATVLYVEPPNGDPLRRTNHALFGYLNTNKQSVTLDITKPKSGSLLLKLLRRADVFITEHQSREARRLQLHYTALHKANPRLIVTSITPFGQRGPHANWKANDFIATHIGGVAYGNAPWVADLENHPSLTAPAQIASFYAGLTAATAAIAATFARRQNGYGQQVDISMQEAVASNMRHDVATALWTGQTPVRQIGYVAPTTINTQQPTADGFIAFMLRTERNWAPLMELLGNPEWSKAPLFQNPRELSTHWDGLKDLLGQETRKWPTQKLYESAQAKGVSAAPIATVADASKNTQFLGRNFFVESPSGLRQPGAPVKFGEPLWRIGPAPALGAHTQAALGLSKREHAQLRREGIV